MKLLKAVATITIFTLLTRLLGFVLRIFLSRELGAEGMGIYQIAFSVFVVLLTMTSSGVPLIVSRQSAKYIEAGDRKRMHSLVSSALFLGTLISVAVSSVVLIFQNQIAVFFQDRSSLVTLLMLLPAVIASGVYSAFHGALWGEKRYFLSSFNEFLEQVIRIFVCIGLFKLTSLDKALSTGLSLSIACIASMAIGITMYFVYGGKLRKFDKELVPLLKSSSTITGIRLSGSIVSSVISILLPLRLMKFGLSKGQALAAIGTLLGMVFPLLFLPTAFIGAIASVLVPELSSAKTRADKCKKVESAVSVSVLIAAMCIPVFIGAGQGLGMLVYDSSEAGKYIMYSGIIMIPLAIEQITSSMMNSLDLEFAGFVNYIVGSVFLVIFIVIATPFMGVLAYIVGTFIQLTISSILDVISIKRKIGNKLTFIKPLIVSTLLLVPVSALAYSAGKLFVVMPLWLNVVLSAIIACAAMFLLCMAFGLFDLAGVRLRKKKKLVKQKNNS